MGTQIDDLSAQIAAIQHHLDRARHSVEKAAADCRAGDVPHEGTVVTIDWNLRMAAAHAIEAAAAVGALCPACGGGGGIHRDAPFQVATCGVCAGGR